MIVAVPCPFLTNPQLWLPSQNCVPGISVWLNRTLTKPWCAAQSRPYGAGWTNTLWRAVPWCTVRCTPWRRSRSRRSPPASPPPTQVFRLRLWALPPAWLLPCLLINSLPVLVGPWRKYHPVPICVRQQQFCAIWQTHNIKPNSVTLCILSVINESYSYFHFLICTPFIMFAKGISKFFRALFKYVSANILSLKCLLI